MQALHHRCLPVKRLIYRCRWEYPFIRSLPFGTSVLGRSIPVLSVGNVKCATLYIGGVHAKEWLTVLLVLKFFEDLCHSAKTGQELYGNDVSKVLSERGLIIIPCVNPDGVEISLCGSDSAGYLSGWVDAACNGDTALWQANARGIDINHNFDAGFLKLKRLEREAGIIGPCPSRYGGERPESEPETKTVCNICRRFPIRQAIAFHSQGEEIYYRYGEHTPPRSKVVGRMLALSSGYRLCDPVGTASHGGFKDWFIDTFSRPAFTVEIGRGTNPLDIAELGPIYARLVEMMILGLII